MTPIPPRYTTPLARTSAPRTPHVAPRPSSLPLPSLPTIGLIAPTPAPAVLATPPPLSSHFRHPVCNMKAVAEASVGDTFHKAGEPVDALPGFKPTKAMVRSRLSLSSPPLLFLFSPLSPRLVEVVLLRSAPPRSAPPPTARPARAKLSRGGRIGGGGMSPASPPGHRDDRMTRR